MRKLYAKILSLKESQMRDTILYSFGSLCSSAASMILLLVVTRIMGQEISGVFSLAWSASQLMLTVGWFGTRQYQVSDVNGVISYYEYFTAKIISAGTMLVLGLAYVYIYRYETHTKIITLFLCVMMIADVFADFFSGFFQCNNRLYIGGVSYAVRNISYVLMFAVTMLLFRNLIFSIICAIVTEMLWLFFFDYQLVKMIPKKNKSVRIRAIVKLFVECMPLFFGSFMNTFIVNVPKNAIDLYMDYNSQACYNILFMPTAVINLLNMFICVPFYTRMAVLWQENQRKVFLKVVCRITGLVMLITVGVLVGGALLGIPVLSWLYGVELSPYRNAFLVLILGGGFYGVVSALTYVITVFRKQRVIIYVYVVCAVLAQLLVGTLVRNFEMMGAAVTYTVTLGAICLGLVLYIWYYLRKYENNGGGEKNEEI